MIHTGRLCGMCVAVASLSVALSPASSAPHDEAAIAIDAGAAVERSVAIGEEHLYRITLAAGECAAVMVDQRGIDVVVRVRRAGDGDVVEFQEEVRRNGLERVDIVAEQPGDYLLAIAPSRGIFAGTYAVRLEGRRTASAADRSLFEARRLRTEAQRLTRAAKYGEAARKLEQALSLSEAVRDPGDLFVGILVLDLANAVMDARNDARAAALFNRALATFVGTFGDAHPYWARVQTRLAALELRAANDYGAEALLQPAMAVLEQTVGADHTWYATGLITQATLRHSAGDLERAEQIDRHAKRILEAIGATETHSYWAVLNNLGLIYADQGDLTRAEEHYRRGLAILEALEGSETYRVSLVLQNISIIARRREDSASAREYLTRALAVRERLLGTEHVDVAPILNLLGLLRRDAGDFAGALEMHARALRIWETSYGPYHVDTLVAMGNIALVYTAMGDLGKAIAFQRRCDAIIEKHLELNLAIGRERDSFALVASMSDRTVSLHLRHAAGDAEAGTLAALAVLQRKGRVLDAMTDAFAAVRRRSDDSDSRALLDQLTDVTSELARVAFDANGATASDDLLRSIGALETEKERLEAALMARNAELRAQMQPVTLETVQAAVPANAALVEFTIFRPFDRPISNEEKMYGPARYAAYVIRRDAAPLGVDLGPVAVIDREVDALRQAMRDRTTTDVIVRARAVYDLLLRPLRLSAGDAHRLLISPDGALNLLPFEALLDEEGRYLIERVSVSYLTSGRDLLRLQQPRTPRSPPVIIADPRYSQPASDARVSRRQPLGVDRYRTADAGDVESLYFAPLANTAEEARAIKRLFPDAVLLTGQYATKAAFARLDAPRMLHIASHGFFLQDDARNGGAGAAIQNPLLRSGIALAGANLGHELRGDGILTALEASGLNLWGTKLVTLSACDTGVGEVRNGEGVYGLRRAFLLAGTETTVMSLWPVSDYIARETMVAYYAGLRAGAGRGEALRQAKLAMLRRKNRQHPFYWASFIQSGEWASLDGRR
jgi:CHAT domain-containing protein/tetratricopeptide (TPR) repeat protein